jgi:hypothetical protein
MANLHGKEGMPPSPNPMTTTALCRGEHNCRLRPLWPEPLFGPIARLSPLCQPAAPPPFIRESPLSAAHSVLQAVFGYEQFRGPQEAIVSHVVAGGDALVLMPTGGGKSLCYQVPASCASSRATAWRWWCPR